MGDFTEETTVNDERKLAADDSHRPVNDDRIECPNCKNEDTVCIFEEASGCIIGYTIEREFYCPSCGKYIVHIWDYES